MHGGSEVREEVKAMEEGKRWAKESDGGINAWRKQSDGGSEANQAREHALTRFGGPPVALGVVGKTITIGRICMRMKDNCYMIETTSQADAKRWRLKELEGRWKRCVCGLLSPLFNFSRICLRVAIALQCLGKVLMSEDLVGKL